MAKWIMVVDDDTANLQMAGHILSKNNMRVTALKSGKAMIDYILEKGTPDLILLDIKMPEMDGFETLRALRKLEAEKGFNETPVIFLTADEEKSTESRGLEEGVSDFIRKPFHPDVLLKRINNIVSMQSEMKSLKNEATTDKLTGFLNKAATGAVLSKMCFEMSGCLMMIDLDSFKLVNDLYGHAMGDNVLIAFADIIRGTMPEGSRFGRIGGDEFVSFAAGVSQESAVSEITTALNDKLLNSAHMMMGEDMSIPLGASVGAIMVPKQGNDYHSLLKQADKALYKVKKNGKHGYQIYSSNAFSEEDANPENLTIRELSEILGERNIPEVALQLEMDAFSYVYRYVIRYIARHNVTASKVLYTLEPAEGVSDEEYKDLCDEFGNHVRQCLRKSDILTRSRYNQYYVFLTDIREEYSDIVISQVIDSWNLENPAKLTITYESETIHNRFDLYTEPGERRVYIVDDDEMILSQAKEILEVNGIAVFTFSSGKELISSLESEEKKPDLILLDIKMPEMDGFETLEKIRTFSDRIANTPVIFLTGDDSEILESKGFSMGAIDFIRKPIVPEITLLRVNHILELVALRKRVHK